MNTQHAYSKDTLERAMYDKEYDEESVVSIYGGKGRGRGREGKGEGRHLRGRGDGANQAGQEELGDA